MAGVSRSRKSVSRSVKIAEFYGGFCPFETPIVSNRLTKAREARNVSIKRAVERSLLWNLLARSFYRRRGKGWPRAQERGGNGGFQSREISRASRLIAAN